MSSNREKIGLFKPLKERFDSFTINEYGELDHKTILKVTPSTIDDVFVELEKPCKERAKPKGKF